MTSLLNRILSRPTRTQPLNFTVYTRAGCCCCHTAIELLASYQRKYAFAIHEVDVDTDPRLAHEYGSSVPVVTLGGKVRFRGVVNPNLLSRLLHAECCKSAPDRSV